MIGGNKTGKLLDDDVHLWSVDLPEFSYKCQSFKSGWVKNVKIQVSQFFYQWEVGGEGN